MFFRKMIFLILLMSLSVYILGKDNYEGYIAIRVNRLLKYDFAKVYTDEDMKKIYVNLPEMLELIELDTVRYDEEKGVVEGHIPHQLIPGSDLDRKILWKTNENAVIREGELYVEYREIQNILPMKEITWSISELFLDIDYEFRLPVELKLLRADQRKRNLYKDVDDDDDDDDDVIKVERAIMTPGILSLNFNWSDFSKGDQSLTYQYNSIFLYGKLSLSGELYEDQSLDFYRLDYDNILKDKTISLGKTTLFNIPRIFKGGSGIKGISINRKSVDFTVRSDQGKETIEGFAPVNSTVELYQNNFLIKFQSVDNSGFFRFSEIQSKSFSDSYTVKIYDERAFLLEERKYSSLFKSDFLKKGETDYQLAIGEADNDDKNLVSGVDFYWGIFDRMTYNLGFYYSENKTFETEENLNGKIGEKVLKNSLLYRSKMIHYPYYTKLDVYTDIESSNNAYDWEYKQKLFLDLQLDLYYSKNEKEIEDLTNYSDRYKAALKRNFGDWYLRLEYERVDFFEEDSEEDYVGEVTYNINSSTRFTFTEKYNTIEEDHLTTASLDYRFNNGINLQLETGKNWGDNSDSEFARLVINMSPNRSKTPYSFRSGVQFSGNDGDEDWSAFISMSYYFGRGGTFTGSYDTENNETFGMNYMASVNLARPLENHPPDGSSSSWVEGNIFLDENLNGQLDEGEIPVEGVGILSGSYQATSDEKGYYYLGGISPDSVNEIKYSYENLNPDLISLNDKNKLIIPSTAGYYYSIPLTTASGVTGFVEFDSDLEIKERTKKMIFTRMNIQIIEGNKIIREIPVEPGGFYILDGLKPGKYRVRASYLGVKEITFEKDEILLEINPGKYGNFYEGINLKIKTY